MVQMKKEASSRWHKTKARFLRGHWLRPIFLISATVLLTPALPMVLG